MGSEASPVRPPMKVDPSSKHRATKLPLNSTRAQPSSQTAPVSASPSGLSSPSSPDVAYSQESLPSGCVSPLQLPVSPFAMPLLPSGQNAMGEALQSRSPGLMRRLSGRAGRLVRNRQSSNNIRNRDQSSGPLVTRRRSGSKSGYETDAATEDSSAFEEDFLALDISAALTPTTPASIHSRSRQPSRVEEHEPPIIPSELLCPTRLTKVTRKKGRKQIYLVLDPQAAKVTWASKSKCLYIDDIQAIRTKDDAKKNRDDLRVEAEVENRWLTIVYAHPTRSKGRPAKEMNLIFPDDEKLFESWITTLKRLYKYRHDLIVGLAGPGLDEGTLRSRWKQEMDKVFQKQCREVAQETLDFHGVESVCRSLNINWSGEKIKEKIDKASPTASGRLGYEQFRAFVKAAKVREEVGTIFKSVPKEKASGLNFSEFLRFLEERQGTPVDTHSLYWKQVFEKYIQLEQETASSQGLSDDPVMGFSAFNAFLSSAENGIIRLETGQDPLDRPLNEYFISSSHNTYLLGRQFLGESTTEGYVRALQEGCRCIEIDCWDGGKDFRHQPTVTHGRTRTSRILFADCISVISKYAFDASPYPLILSLEVHCNADQQEIMVDIMLREFGDRLVKEVLAPNSENLPSPEQLKRRILVKAKTRPVEVAGEAEIPVKQSGHTRQRSVSSPAAQQQLGNTSPSGTITPTTTSKWKSSVSSSQPSTPNLTSSPRISISSDDSEVGLSMPYKSTKETKKTKTKIVERLDRLCVYTRGLKYRDFSFEESGSYGHIFSLNENVFERLCREKGNSALLEQHNMKCLMRVYPKAMRWDSTNFDPVQCWKRGVQMVALNYQTHDAAKQINDAMFAGGSDRYGYVLKPRDLRPREGISEHITEALRPKLLNRIDLTVKVISAQFLPRPRGGNGNSVPSPYVEVQVYIPDEKNCGSVSSGSTDDVPVRDKAGPCMSVRRRTKPVPHNGYDPLFNTSFDFSITTSHPELVFVRWSVWNSSDGHSHNNNEGAQPEATFAAKYVNLLDGFRHVPLRNHLGEQYSFSTIFCQIQKGDVRPVSEGIKAQPVSSPRWKKAAEQVKGLKKKTSRDNQKDDIAF